jgi:hypothetical protein
MPVCTAEIDQMYGLQSNVKFNLNNISQVLTNNQSQVIFYEWNFETGLTYFCPEINDEVNILLFIKINL